jgi:hypothetical protein
MPILGQETRIDLMCGPGGCFVVINVKADALRRLGLHPSQPSSKIVGPTPWWRH